MATEDQGETAVLPSIEDVTFDASGQTTRAIVTPMLRRSSRESAKRIPNSARILKIFG
jgi:hypothetical protein